MHSLKITGTTKMRLKNDRAIVVHVSYTRFGKVTINDGQAKGIFLLRERSALQGSNYFSYFEATHFFVPSLFRSPALRMWAHKARQTNSSAVSVLMVLLPS